MATQLTDEELFSVLDADHTFETKAEAGRSLGLTRKGFLRTVWKSLGIVWATSLIMASLLKASAHQSCRPMSCPRMS